MGRAPRIKETSVRFSLNHGSQRRGHGGVVLGYTTSTSLLWVDGLSTNPRVLGRHSWDDWLNSFKGKMIRIFVKCMICVLNDLLHMKVHI